MKHPSADRVRDLFHYDEEKGILIWKRHAGRVKAGSIAGRKHEYGYTVIGVDGLIYGAHRLIWLYVTGEWPTIIDHINGIRDCNVFSNLRNADAATNSQNRKIDHSKNRLLGAYRSRGSGWASSMTVDGRRFHLGVFSTEQKAHEAYVEARRLIVKAEQEARVRVLTEVQQAQMGRKAA